MVHYSFTNDEKKGILPILSVSLSPGEKVFGEVASLVMCDGGVSIKTFSGSSTNNGGFFSGLKKMLGGENFFGLEFENRNGASEAKVLLSPNGIGEVLFRSPIFE